MDFFTIMTRWFWAICIVCCFANAAVLRFRAQKRIHENPELEDGYRIIIKGFLIWMNIPWIVMGIGHLVGGVPTVLHFFRPSDGNPYVLGFWASIVVMWVLGTYWLFYRQGAEMLVRHPGLFRSDFKSAITVKFHWILCVAGGVVALIAMFIMDIPLPNG